MPVGGRGNLQPATCNLEPEPPRSKEDATSVISHVAPEDRRTAAQSDIVFVDGAEQLGPLAWWRFRRIVRQATGLVITSHRSGRLPTLIECRTSPTLLRELVTELAPDDIEKLEPRLDDLFERHKGNLRSCLRELYDRYAGRSR